jgi:hypothetical protein
MITTMTASWNLEMDLTLEKNTDIDHLELELEKYMHN